MLDIKPYLPYSDALQDATGGYAPAAPGAGLKVRFGGQAEEDLTRLQDSERMRALLREVLALDPRPAAEAEATLEAAGLTLGATYSVPSGSLAWNGRAFGNFTSKSIGPDLFNGGRLDITYVTPVAAIAGIEELNIGHSIVSRALMVGMTQAVREMKQLIR